MAGRPGPMPYQGTQDGDGSEYSQQFSSLQLHDAYSSALPSPAQMMYPDGLASPAYPFSGMPHAGPSQYSLQSPYMASGPAMPGHGHGHAHNPYGYPTADLMQMPYEYGQHMSMPIHQRSHTSPAQVVPHGFAPAYEYAYGSPPISPSHTSRPSLSNMPSASYQSHMRGGSMSGRGRRPRHGSFREDVPGPVQGQAYGQRGAGRGGYGMGYPNSHFGPQATPYNPTTPSMSQPPSNWTSPTIPSTQHLTPHPPASMTIERQGSEWSVPGSPVAPHTTTDWRNRQNRLSWTGHPPGEKAGEDGKEERKAYHPQAPAKRSDWVMWVGNVPQNTSHEELWRFFNSTVPDPLPEESDPPPWKGPSSIFLISRSSCAFVNLSSQSDLDRAVAFFNGRPLRAWDNRCPRMVCRVRLKDDDLKSGVGGQRGTGMHRAWVKAQSQTQVPKVEGGDAGAVAQGEGAAEEVDDKPTEATVPPPLHISPPNPLVPLESPDALSIHTTASSIPPSPAVLEHPPEGEGRRRESIINVDIKHRSTNSYASTNSSFLVRHFPKRFFILKSAHAAELQDAAKTGLWRTQRHNEPILDQAFRTAAEVILVFGANKAGEFFGYAKMVEPIDKEKAARRSAAAALASAASAGSGSGSGGSDDSSGRKPSAPSGLSAGATGIEVANAVTAAEKAGEDGGPRFKLGMSLGPLHADSAPVLSTSDPTHGSHAADQVEVRDRAGTDPTRPKYLSARTSSSQFHTTSPGEMTPANELSQHPGLAHRSSSSVQTVSTTSDHSIVSAPPTFPAAAQVQGSASVLPVRPPSSDWSDLGRPTYSQAVSTHKQTHARGASSSYPNPVVSHKRTANPASAAAAVGSASEPPSAAADVQAMIGGSDRPQERSEDGVLRKDTVVAGIERVRAEMGLVGIGKERVEALEGKLQAAAAATQHEPGRGEGGREGEGEGEGEGQVDPNEKGQPFKIEWIRIASLPFSRTRMLRNPWNNDREVKVSRDGTEIEPGIGSLLLAEWDQTDTTGTRPFIRPAPTPVVSGHLGPSQQYHSFPPPVPR